MSIVIKTRRSGQDIRKLLSMDVIGRPGGIARAKKLSAARRKEIATGAAKTRWKTKKRVRIETK